MLQNIKRKDFFVKIHYYLYDGTIDSLIKNLQLYIKENAEIYIKASKDIGLEVKSDKTKYIITSRQQNIVQNENIVIENFTFSRWKSSNIRE